LISRLDCVLESGDEWIKKARGDMNLQEV